MLTPAVEKAISDLMASYPTLRYAEDGAGGAHVLIEKVPLGSPFAQETTWVGFSIASTCPYADTYPHYFRPDLSRIDGSPLTNPIHLTGHQFPPAGSASDERGVFDRTAIMVSRRSTRRDASGIESPLTKLNKVLRWIRTS